MGFANILQMKSISKSTSTLTTQGLVSLEHESFQSDSGDVQVHIERLMKFDKSTKQTDQIELAVCGSSKELTVLAALLNTLHPDIYWP